MGIRAQAEACCLAGAGGIVHLLQAEASKEQLIQDQAQAADLYVSIVNWNTRADLLRCLESVFGSELGDMTVRVMVVDNASSDGSIAAVADAFPQVTLIASEANLGFAAGNNRAISRTCAGDVLVLNPDTVLERGTLAELMRFRREHPMAGIIGPKVLNPDGSIQHSARAFPTLAAGLFRHSFLGRLFPGNKYTKGYLQSEWDHSDARQVDWVSGCAMLVTREALADLGGFDEDYFMYVEDVDICWRARQMGWEVWFCPDAVLTHEKAKASDLAQGKMIWQHHRSMYRFYLKHYRERAGLLERLVTPAGILARAVVFVSMNRVRRWLRAGR